MDSGEVDGVYLAVSASIKLFVIYPLSDSNK